MTLMNAIVRPATGEDAGVLVPAIADALMIGGLGTWLVPDATDRADVLRRYAQGALARGMATGQVDTTDDRRAVAVWYPRLAPQPPSSEWKYDLHRLLGAHAPRFALLHAYLDVAAHPKTPHHYLAHLAARPGHGAAAMALLTSYHRLLDAERLPAYTELCSDRPRNGLLVRLGYLPRSPILLEPGGPAMWRMVRPVAGDEQLESLPRRTRLGRPSTPWRARCYRRHRVLPDQADTGSRHGTRC